MEARVRAFLADFPELLNVEGFDLRLDPAATVSAGEEGELWLVELQQFPDPAKSAYRVASGGKCNPSAQVDGCGSDNWYMVFLAADDDDGDLSNGTPNACRIWDTFNAHGIACGARPACTR